MAWLTNIFAPFMLNPAVAAAGAGLVAAPIIIHLINRMRYRKVRFAAMEFLLASEQKNRRRVLLEQLLLLLLRVLIVIGLILLIARLVLDPSALALLRAGAKTHHVVLLDDSGSMRSRTGDSTAFDEAKTIVRRLVAEAARGSGSQQLTLVLLSQADQDAAFFSEETVNEAFLNEFDTKFENVVCTHQRLDLADGVEMARRRLLPERSGTRFFHVLSDFRQSDWLDEPGLLAEISELGKSGVAVNLVRVVENDAPNLAITSLIGDLDAVAAGVPMRLKVGVTNFGNVVAENVPVGVAQDRQKLPISEKLTKIEPGTEVFTEFDLAFQAPGRHSLRLELPADTLAADDQRYVALNVAASHPVLIIDGTPGQGDGPGLIADALAPVSSLSGLSPRIETIDFLRRNPLSQYRAIYLLNVPSLPGDAVRALENYVRAGGGLSWFVGNAVQPAFYNSELYRNPDRTEAAGNAAEPESPGLFPVPLARARVDRQRNPDSQAADIQFQPVGRFEPFAGELGKYWIGARVETYLPADPDWERDDDRRADGVVTVARLTGGEPLILSHQFGSGRVLTVLTSAGQSWTNWPRQFIYVPFMLESFNELAGARGEADSREVGTVLSIRRPAAEYDPEIRIERPDGTAVTVRATPSEQDTEGDTTAQPLMLHATYRETDEPGIYTILTAPVSGGTLQESSYALNAPIAESRLRLADPAALRKQLVDAPNVSLRDPTELGWLRVHEAGREARLVLVLLLIALLIGEQALACRLSYHPKTPARAQWQPA